MYELHYQTGGHGGPYNLDDAVRCAVRFLRTNRACGSRIEIREGVGGPLVRSLFTVDGTRVVETNGRGHLVAYHEGGVSDYGCVGR